ncbi:MAG: hypothetical protein RLZZ258_1278 [Actinomycetota bacterium]|jgi:hypothetical protein|uniref:hypothetical protein n=1 Tax=Rhodoluna sp. TaxID=1969481 RepID=UPI0025F8127F|nr:hypothetical protein [Rhodoluna sp.]
MEILEIIIRITLVLHLLGFASIMSGTLSQTKNFKTGAPVTSAVIHGAWLSLLTGVVLTGLVYAADETVNNLVISIKGLGIIGIFFIAYTFSKKETAPKWAVPTILLLTVVNLSIAVITGVTVE